MDSIYIGGFTLMSGLVDLKIDFKTVEPICDNSGAFVQTKEEVANRITLSMPLAKDLYVRLGEMLGEYEGKFGSIKTTTELLEIAGSTSIKKD